MENVLGILGGMGPMASQQFCKLLISNTKAETDKDHINFILINHATMPDRTAAILGGNAKELYELLLADCKKLEAAGCKAICVACNTSHYFVHQFEHELSVPVISLIRESAAEMAKRFPGGRIGVLATDGTVQTELYQNALKNEGLEAFVPSQENQKRVMKLIYDCVKAGKPGDKNAAYEIEKELKDAGCSCALLACTELPLLKEDGIFTGDYYADPIEIMAKKAVVFMGKELR